LRSCSAELSVRAGGLKRCADFFIYPSFTHKLRRNLRAEEELSLEVKQLEDALACNEAASLDTSRKSRNSASIKKHFNSSCLVQQRLVSE
jgi:hypothetical protein